MLWIITKSLVSLKHSYGDCYFVHRILEIDVCKHLHIDGKQLLASCS